MREEKLWREVLDAGNVMEAERELTVKSGHCDGSFN